MGRAPCCEKMGLKKGPWSPEEDRILMCYIQQHGHPNWRALPKRAGLLRCGKSCRLRWVNYLKPDIRRGNFTIEEEQAIINLHEIMGNRWSAIAAKLPGRTDNEIKNVWHTHLKKRLNQTNSNNNNNNSTTKKNQLQQHLKEATSPASTVTNSNDSNNDYDVQLVESPQDSSTNTSPATATATATTTTSTTTNTTDQLSPSSLAMDTSSSSSSSSATAMMQSFIEIDESFWSENFTVPTEDDDMINSYFDMCNNIDTTTTTTINNNDELLFLDTSMAAGGYYPAVGYDGFGFESDDHEYYRPHQEQHQQQVQIAAGGVLENESGVVLGGDVDFWYNVFVTAGGSPELQEF